MKYVYVKWTGTPQIIAALSVVAKVRNRSRCPIINVRVKKMPDNDAIEHYPDMKAMEWTGEGNNTAE